MTPRESGTPGCPEISSEEKSREFVDILLDNGEHAALLDAIAIDTDTEDIDDVTGWGCSISLPKPPVTEARRDLGLRKKNSKQNQPEMDLSNMRIRFVNEDFANDHQRSIWKANVEPGTYRYISNNGIYRSTKFASIGSDWVTAKRSRHYIDHNSTTTNPDVKQAQKTLRKELDHHFKSRDNMKHEGVGPASYTPDCKVNHARQADQESSKNTSSANTATNESESLPPPSRPQKDPKLVKSASDLFVENFSTRISAMEKSEKETNPSASAPRTPCSPQKSGMSSMSQVPNKRQSDHLFSDTAKMVVQVDDISKDVFTVRPVTRAPDQPLGPLEKLTPQQKLLERNSESDCSSVQSKSQPESPSLPTSFMTAMNAFAQLHTNAHRPKNKNSKSNPSTYRHPYKSSSMSNVSDTDSLNSVRNALTLTNSNIERMRMGTISNSKNPVKDYGRFLGNKPKLGQASTTAAFGRTVGSSSSNTNSITGASVNGSNFQKRSVVGYKTVSNSAPVSYGAPALRPAQPGPNSIPQMMPSSIKVEDTACGLSETSESYLSGTSLTVNRGSGSLRGEKNGMALPEISGKRLAVTTTTQRML